MKISIALLLLMMTLASIWLWPKHEPPWHWVVFIEQQGMLVGRDQSIHLLPTQPVREVIMIGSNSARSAMLFRMLEAHERLQQQQITFTTLLLDYVEQFDELDVQIVERMPDVLILDACEWMDQPARQRAVSAWPITTVSLCADQPIQQMSNLLVVQQLDANKNPALLQQSKPLSRNMQW